MYTVEAGSRMKKKPFSGIGADGVTFMLTDVKSLTTVAPSN
jgi:hypothetical protein